MHLENLLQQHLQRQPFKMGIAVHHLASGERASVYGDELFPTASTFKVPLLYTLMRKVDAGKIALDDRIRIPSSPSLGSGLLKYFRRDGELTLAVSDLAHLMIDISDNLATDILMDLVGGAAAIDEEMRHLGTTDIHVPMDCFHLLCTGLGWDAEDRSAVAARLADEESIDWEMAADNLVFQQVPENDVASPNHMVDLLTEILQPRHLSEASANVIVDIMSRQQFTQRMPALLPSNVKTINKTGTVKGIRCDVGAMYLEDGPVAFAAFILDTPPDMGRAGDLAIAEAARLVHDYYSEV